MAIDLPKLVESLRLSVPQKVRLGLRLASEIVPKLPSKDDTVLQVAIKCLAIVDSAKDVLAPASKAGGLRDLIERYDLEETKNEQFVSLFFDTNLYEQFKVHRIGLTDYMEVIDASHKSFGRLFFVEYTYSNEGPEPVFYHSKGMDFPEVLKGLWEVYEHRLHVTVTAGEYGMGTKSEFTSFKEGEKNPLYGSMGDKMTEIVARHRRYQTDKIPRTYMFYGPPGTGKTSFAMALADRLGERTLKMDAQSLSFVHVKEMSFLLDNLRPDFLILNDVDKADVSKGIPTLLEILERFKVEHPEVCVLMTSNTTDNFNEGMFRPARIDTWVEFPLPDEGERREVITRYLESYKVLLPVESLGMLVTATEGLSQDYLRETVSELRYDDLSHVTGNIALRQKLLQSAKKKAEDGPTPDAKTESKPAV